MMNGHDIATLINRAHSMGLSLRKLPQIAGGWTLRSIEMDRRVRALGKPAAAAMPDPVQDRVAALGGDRCASLEDVERCLEAFAADK